MDINFSTLSANLSRVYSPRIALRPLTLADGWPLFEATKNPLFNQYLTWPKPDQEVETLERVDLIMDAVAKGQMSAVSAVVRSTGEWIGLFRFQPYRHNGELVKGAIEAGIWSRDTFWDGRTSLEVGVLSMDAGFKFTNADMIYGLTAPENRSSCAIMERGGLHRAGLTTRITEDDREIAAQEFCVTREQWNAKGHAVRLFNYRDRQYPPAPMRAPQAAPAPVMQETAELEESFA